MYKQRNYRKPFCDLFTAALFLVKVIPRESNAESVNHAFLENEPKTGYMSSMILLKVLLGRITLLAISSSSR